MTYDHKDTSEIPDNGQNVTNVSSILSRDAKCVSGCAPKKVTFKTFFYLTQLFGGNGMTW